MMVSTIIIPLSSIIFSFSLGSPFPEAEADPGLVKVIKTIQIWDDEDQDAKIVEDLDIDGLNVEYDVNVPSNGLSEEIDLSPVYENSHQGRDLVGGYVGNHFQPASHDASHNHHHRHDHSQHQKPNKYSLALKNNGLDGSSIQDSRDIDLNKLPVARNFTTFTNAPCPLIWTKIQESQDAQIRSADDRVDWLFVRPS